MRAEASSYGASSRIRHSVLRESVFDSSIPRHKASQEANAFGSRRNLSMIVEESSMA